MSNKGKSIEKETRFVVAGAGIDRGFGANGLGL